MLNDDKGVLNKLVEALQRLDKNACSCISEINHLSEFGDELCAQGFSPKWIIGKMTERYMLTQQNVRDDFNALQLLSSVHVNDAEQKVYEYTFTNAMSFDVDIHTLCHLYFLVSRCGLGKEPVVVELMKIMEEKYGINTKLESVIGLHAEVITLSRIAHSYPSVMLDVFSDDVDSRVLFFSTLFPDLRMLPKMIFSPTIASLLPSLDNFPYVVLIAITLLLESYSGLRTKTPLESIYKNIRDARFTMIFPESLKYELCWKWGLICEGNYTYAFLPSFEYYREAAKNLIIEMRGEDPFLFYIFDLL